MASPRIVHIGRYTRGGVTGASSPGAERTSDQEARTITSADAGPRRRVRHPGPGGARPSAGQASGQHRLGLLGALAALPLGAAEELGEVVVALTLGVLHVGLQPKRV